MTEKPKKSFEQYEKHLHRVSNCSTTFELGYVQTSHIEFKVHPCAYCCGSYFCKTCANSKRKKLLKRLRNIKSNTNLRFLTLTLSDKYFSPTTSINKISEFFNTFCKLLRYRGYKFDYFKIIEMTKNNISHIHVLIDCYIPQPLISALWRQITKSYITKILFIHNTKQVFQYVSKYITKTINQFSNLLFFFYSKRRYSASKNFFLKTEILEKFKMTGIKFYNIDDFENILHKFFSSFIQYNFIKFTYFTKLN